MDYNILKKMLLVTSLLVATESFGFPNPFAWYRERCKTQRAHANKIVAISWWRKCMTGRPATYTGPVYTIDENGKAQQAGPMPKTAYADLTAEQMLSTTKAQLSIENRKKEQRHKDGVAYHEEYGTWPSLEYKKVIGEKPDKSMSVATMKEKISQKKAIDTLEAAGGLQKIMEHATMQLMETQAQQQQQDQDRVVIMSEDDES